MKAPWELRVGRYQDVLQDVEQVDTLISDPPYGARTHEGQRHGRKSQAHTKDSALLSARGLAYAAWTPADVQEFVGFWAPRVRHWMCVMTSHDLVPVYTEAMQAAGLYAFAPLACVQHAMNVRLAGDGPSNWTVWMVVARRKGMKLWGSLPGAYVGPSSDPGQNALDRSKRPVAGGKPSWLMRAIIRDYSRPGDRIVDPCAGGGRTLLDAVLEGRRAIGAEVDPVTAAAATGLLERGVTPDMLACLVARVASSDANKRMASAKQMTLDSHGALDEVAQQAASMAQGDLLATQPGPPKVVADGDEV